MLTDKEVEHIARLARIELSDALRERMKQDLSSVLEYIALLNEADTEGVEPLAQVTGLQNVTRSDDSRPKLVPDEKLTELLVGQAPQREGRYVKVKTVRVR